MDVRRAAAWTAMGMLVLAYATPGWRTMGYLPGEAEVPAGDRVRLAPPLPPGLAVRRLDGGAGTIWLDGRPLNRAWRPLGERALDVRVARPGRYALGVGAWGLSVRRVRLDARAPRRLAVGGQSIGLGVRTAGLLVVGRAWPGGAGVGWPFAASPLGPGDRIVAAEGASVAGESDLRTAVERAGRAGRAVRLTVVRDGRARSLALRPRFDAAAGRYRLGVVVRDRLTGIGTLSMYDPATGLFAALGHAIQEGGLGPAVPVTGGNVVAAPIQGVRRGLFGRPGEKVGSVDAARPWGCVDGAGPYGVYGHLRAPALAAPLLPLATASEVHTGRAWLRTVVRGQRVERFAVRIERVAWDAGQGRQLVVRVEDPRLLALTGGIVQGMSGSPIVQDGRIAGVLTHVLVSDPTRGYGVFAERVWNQALHDRRRRVSCA
jgi:stage IV sporulation protein B